MVDVKEDRDKFNKWRSRVSKGLPELAMRVFALRGNFYSGCGFGWAMEKALGGIIRDIQDYDYYPDYLQRMIIQISVSQLHKDLQKVEREIKTKNTVVECYGECGICDGTCGSGGKL